MLNERRKSKNLLRAFSGFSEEKPANLLVEMHVFSYPQRGPSTRLARAGKGFTRTPTDADCSVLDKVWLCEFVWGGLVPGTIVLVASQGFTGLVNKRDEGLFPHLSPCRSPNTK